MGLGKTLQALCAVGLWVLEQREGGGKETKEEEETKEKSRDVTCGVSLVVCPASVCLHWLTETKMRFPVSLLRAVPFSQWAQGGEIEGEGEGGHVLVVASYDTVRRQLGPGSGGGKHNKHNKHSKKSKKGGKGNRDLSETRWEHLILDEAHLVKNPRTQTSKAVFGLASRSKHRLALTGTPVQNQVGGKS